MNHASRIRAALLGECRRPGAPAMAALANGALAHALDFEDTFDPAGLHPNAALIPAVLALAEAHGAIGGDVLAAIAVGCDISCRIGLALASGPAARGWYRPPVIGGIGAAFGAAHLLRLTPEQTVSAVSLAACQFALTDELKRSPASDLRAVRDGLAARAAVRRRPDGGRACPHRGAAGGARRVLRRTDGRGTCGRPPRRVRRAVPRRARQPQALACCRGTHRYLALALALRDEGVAAARIGLDRVGHDLEAGVRLSMRDGEVLVRAAAEPPALLAGSASFDAVRPKLADCLEGGGQAADRLVQAVSELGAGDRVDLGRLFPSADPAGCARVRNPASN